MTISKIVSTLSLVSALVAAAVALAPSNAEARFKSQHPGSGVVRH